MNVMEKLIQFLIQLLFVLSDPLLVVIVDLLVLFVHVQSPSLDRKRIVIFLLVRGLEPKLRNLGEGSLGFSRGIPETDLRGTLVFHLSSGG